MTLRIKPFFKGLGDHLQFSTLPEILSGLDNKIHLHSEAIFSNPEIKDLVYDCNPFISGESFGNWDYGDGSSNWKYESISNSFIRNIEFSSGLVPQNDNPKIYYEPKKVEGFDVLIDLSSVCLQDKLDYAKAKIKINDLINREFDGAKIVVVESNFSQPNNFLEFDSFRVDNLRHYVDLIFSSKTYISFLSGGHSLAASIKHFGISINQYCILPEFLPGLGRGDEEGLSFYDYHTLKGFWTFPDVKYIKY